MVHPPERVSKKTLYTFLRIAYSAVPVALFMLVGGQMNQALAETPAQSDEQFFWSPGYEVDVYAGPWSPDMDIKKQNPVSSQKVRDFSLKGKQFTCAVPEGGFTIIKGDLDLPTETDAWFNAGYGPSATSVMTVDGTEVYSKLPDVKEATKTTIHLSPGLHSFKIIHFTPVTSLVCFTNLGQRLGANSVRTRVAFAKQMETQLVDTLDALTLHATDGQKLTDDQLAQANKTIEENQYIFGMSERIVRAALEFTSSYDAHQDYLFKVNHIEWQKNSKREGLRWADFQVMQYLLDHAFTERNLSRFPNLLGKADFATSLYFPGGCAPPANPSGEYKVKIWATFPDTTAQQTFMFHNTARKPTGAYLAPGTLATVTVPQSLVNKGFQIRVGAHANDLARKPKIDRLFRISLLYPIHSTQVQVANPLGGGIYIEVPIGADVGEVEVSLRDIVRAPFFSNTRTLTTSPEQWDKVERHYPAPWADFQSETFMMQVPTTWIYNYKNPADLMTRWDKAVTAVIKVLGYLPGEIGREAYYVQPDTQLRNTVFSPGHPQVNMGGANPGIDKYNGNRTDVYQLEGPSHAADWVFHEFGHGVLLSNPSGEHESSNNFLHAVALNWGLGIDMDKAFGCSRGSQNPNCTLDNTAILWMTGNNFEGGVMDPGQKSYQLQGHAKYVDTARLFGWQTIANFYRMVNQERMAYRHSGGKEGQIWEKNLDPGYYVLRLSESSGIDMRPLFHFWGTPPQEMVTLLASPPASGKDLEVAKTYAAKFDDLIRSGRINRSAKIYDELTKYKGIIPADNAIYQKFALAWYDNWNGKPRTGKLFWTERDHAALWDTYTPQTAEKIRTDVQRLLDLYFPKGRPTDH